MDVVTVVQILKIFSVVLMIAGLYMCFMYLQLNAIMEKGAKSVYKSLMAETGRRRQTERQLKALYGEIDKRDRLTYIEENIRYSGLSRKYQFITPEIVLLFMIFVIAFLAVTGVFFKINGYLIFAVGIIFFMALDIGFKSMRNKRMKKTEDELLTFINAVDGYAGMSDDIIHVLDNASGMLDLESPLRHEIAFAVSAARNSGQESAALSMLMANIEHPFFKTFIRNLEISSRNNANYKDIVAESRGLLKNYTENTKRLENIYNNGRVYMLLMAAVCVVAVSFTAALLKMTVMKLIKTISGYGMGMILILFTVIVFAVSLYNVFIMGIRR